MNRTINGSASHLFCTGCGVILTSSSKCTGRGAQCRQCANKRKREERKRRQVKMQLKLIERLGSKCTHCDKAANIDTMVCFDFHHINKERKEAAISELIAQSRPYKVIEEEADKCILLCACCHRLHHQEHGY